ncbi:MAG TPA: hypothetical protein DGR79_06115 [Clostridiales bacterium]|nr:hypothetical protein [Clostridiales bacterium]
MSLIDSHGRLLGRFNVVNVLVVLAVIVAAAAGTHRLLTVEEEGLAETRTILLTFEVADVRQPSVDAVAVGENVAGYESQIPLGVVVEKWAEPHREPVATAAGQIVMAEVPGRYDLYIVVRAEGVVGPNAITVGRRDLKIGIELPLSGRLFRFKAIIVGIEEVGG